MHIDHSKLIELVAEAAGIDKEAAEKQLQELVTEIKEAIADGDAYELEGLGVFSGIGNNIIFIPADELATEINYKYVGMEPIEMDSQAVDDDSYTTDESAQNEEFEAAGVEASEVEDEDDPFDGLLDNVDLTNDFNDDEEVDEPVSSESESPSFQIDPDKESENDSESQIDPDDRYADVDPDSPFSIAGSEYVEDTDEEEAPTGPAFTEPEEETPAEPVFTESEEESADITPDEEEEHPGPEEWGIDSYKEEDSEKAFSGLFGEERESDSEEELDGEKKTRFSFDTTAAEDEPNTDEELSESLNEVIDEEDPEDDEDFDDPFNDYPAENDLDDEDLEDDEEVVPVISNLSSGGKKEEKEDKEKVKKEKKDKSDSPRDKKKAPVMLWLILIIVVMVGGTYGLGYFGILEIPGIKQGSYNNSQLSQSTPVQQQPEETAATETPVASESNTPTQNTVDDTPAEQPAQTQVTQDVPVDPNQPKYGMMGTVVPAANDGYTIVIYSLSNESNAMAKQRELTQDGYRALVVKIPSTQYGSLWRVSLGQFESLRNAALASEDLKAPFSSNYFITKI